MANANMGSWTVNDLVTKVSKYATLVYDKEVGFRNSDPFMLWGQPGVGKSDGMKQVAQNVGKNLNKKVNIIDVRLINFSPVDLRGIPVADMEKQVAVWLKPYIFQLDGSDDVVNFLILDEITSVPPSVQAVAYQIALDRCIGEHQLTDNTYIIAAGNRMTDKAVANKMSTALADRFTHKEIVCDVDAWKKWALNKGIDTRVIGFINFTNKYLNTFDPKLNDTVFATPRSWEKVDNYIKTLGFDDARDFIEGRVSVGITSEFYTFVKIYDALPTMKDVKEGKADVPKDLSASYAMCSTLTNEIIKCLDVKSNGMVDVKDKSALKNIAKYMGKMDMAFTVLIVVDVLLYNKALASGLLQVADFKPWMSKCLKYVS